MGAAAASNQDLKEKKAYRIPRRLPIGEEDKGRAVECIGQSVKFTTNADGSTVDDTQELSSVIVKWHGRGPRKDEKYSAKVVSVEQNGALIRLGGVETFDNPWLHKPGVFKGLEDEKKKGKKEKKDDEGKKQESDNGLMLTVKTVGGSRKVLHRDGLRGIFCPPALAPLAEVSFDPCGRRRTLVRFGRSNGQKRLQRLSTVPSWR